jgi:hypothetical protein
MQRFIMSSFLSLAIASTSAFAALADTTADTPTIGRVQTMTVSPKELAELKSATQHYLDAALDDEDTFFASVTPSYRGVSIAGRSYSVGQVFGAVQNFKQALSGIVTHVRVIDAHHLGNVYDETAVIGGSADTIDSVGARSVAATWIHKITFNRAADGTLLVARDQVLAKFE